MYSHNHMIGSIICRCMRCWKQILLTTVLLGSLFLAPMLLFAMPDTTIIPAATLIAPVIQTPANNSIINNSQPPISGTAPANVTVTISIDSFVNGSVTSDVVGHWSYTPSSGLSEGPHTLVAQASSGPTQSPASSTVGITIDTIPPAAPVVITPADVALLNSATPIITGTAEVNAQVSIYINGSFLITTTSDLNGQWSFSVLNALTDGLYTVDAIAVDSAQNVSSYSKVNSFTIDTTPPVAPVIQSPIDGSVSSQNQPLILGTSEPKATIRVIIDSTTITTVTVNPLGHWNFPLNSALSDGGHLLQAEATDLAGNVGKTVAHIQFTVDTQSPDTQITSTPAAKTDNADGSFSFQGSDLTSSISSFLCAIDQNPFITCTDPLLFRSLSDGTHTFQVYAVDAAGNIDLTPAIYTWEINRAAVTVSVNQASNQADPTGFAPILFTATFNKPVAGFGDSANDLLFSGTAPGQLHAIISGGPSVYLIAVGGMTGTGTVIVALPAAAATDQYGNSSQASTSSDASVIFRADKPIVTGIARMLPNPSNEPILTWQVTFSEPVQGVDPTDFLAVAAASTGVIVTKVEGSGTTYTITVDRGKLTAGATLGLNLVDNDSIMSVALHVPLAGIGIGNGNVTGEVYTIQTIWRSYLPGIVFTGAANTLPDLIVEQIKTEQGKLQIVIKNIGDAPVNQNFWVDLYIAPSQVPTEVNQIWQMLGQRGAAWGVTQPIPVGGSLTLMIGDASYQPNLSDLGGPIMAGTVLYAQVDSANSSTNYGAVFETHERQATAYNNITMTTAVSTITAR